MNALLYILRTGCQWRNLPARWPHWQAVYYYFDRWKTTGLLERINRHLNQLDRQRQGRQAWPSVLSIDRQSVKLSPLIFEERGSDPHKKVNGRKRQLVVDSGGRLWVARVHAAHLADGPQACQLVGELVSCGNRLKKIYGDQAYNGVFAQSVIERGFLKKKAPFVQNQLGVLCLLLNDGWLNERLLGQISFGG